jgi:cytochrome P450
MPSFRAPVTRTVPPGPPSRFLLGNAADVRQRGAHRFALDNLRQYGNICHYRILRWPVYLISHPDYIKHVLQDNQRNYGKDTFAYRALRLILGYGLVTSQGDFWLRQRRLAQPAFHRQRIEGFAALMTRATRDMLNRWDTYAQNDEPFDLAQEMTQLTLRIAGETLFGIDLTDAADEVGNAVTLGLQEVMRRLMRHFALPLSLPTPKNRRFSVALQTLDKVVYSIIAERRRAPKDNGDLLSMLMLAQDEETRERMTDQQLRDEIMTMMLAGHETTANALIWTWYLLTQHPDVEARLATELTEVLQRRTPTIDDLPHLPYTLMVIQESMRLYPPIYIFSRRAIQDDEIGGYRVPAGTTVSMSPFAMHRHPDYWDDPETFVPERFHLDRIAAQHRFTYIPFAAGPRQCIGQAFALTEIQLVLAAIAQRYRLRLVPGCLIEAQAAITLRPRYGMQVRLECAISPTTQPRSCRPD